MRTLFIYMSFAQRNDVKITLPDTVGGSITPIRSQKYPWMVHAQYYISVFVSYRKHSFIHSFSTAGYRVQVLILTEGEFTST